MQSIVEVLQRLSAGDDAVLVHSSTLLQQSKTEEGRQRLLQSGATSALPLALEPLTHDTRGYRSGCTNREAIVWGLQLARNLCAAGDTACKLLVQHGMLKTVLPLLNTQLSPESSEPHAQG